MESKVFIVTGSGSGIGFQVIKDLIDEGEIVVACTRENTSKLNLYKEKLSNTEKNNLLILKFDLNNFEESKKAVQIIWKTYSRIDVLINSAGIAHGSLFSLTKMEDMEKVFRINLFSIIQFSQLCVRFMMRRKKGVICNISSVTSLRSDIGTLVYGSSKSALNYATKIMAKELGEYGIRVNAIAPGITKTGMLDLMDKSAIEMQLRSSSLNKIAEPKDITSIILFICSDLANHITGELIRVDGGQS